MPGASLHARRYAWADPADDVVHVSIVACTCNRFAGLRGTGTAQTPDDDDLKNLRLLFAVHDSAASGAAAHLPS
jgi:hypothetical protein